MKYLNHVLCTVLCCLAIVGRGESAPNPSTPGEAEPSAAEMQPTAPAAKGNRPSETVSSTRTSPSFLRIDGRAFVDEHGRSVLLHGVNMVSKDKGKGYVGMFNEADFARVREMGMNCVRLGIIWDGLEPEPGVYNDDYLSRMDELIGWAEKYGLYVFLDMHQDLYSCKYSDGAPEWATLTDGRPHITEGNMVWSDAYVTSPAVQRAFDNFWANTPASDGVGIQDHYAKAWQHVAKRYADNTTVIGYDIMNEPFAGTAFLQGQALMVKKAAELLSHRDEFKEMSLEDLSTFWMSKEGRLAMLRLFQDIRLYSAITDDSAPVYQKFEREQLTPMYQRVTGAVREVDTNHILFLGSHYGCNMGVYSGIEKVVDAKGNPDPLQAYVPHGYDIVVDTPFMPKADAGRVRHIFERHAAKSKEMGIPMLVSEWGALGGSKGVVRHAWDLARIFEQLLTSDAYWHYNRNMAKFACLPAIQRAIPVRVAGELTAYSNDKATNAFKCTWRENGNITAPTMIYVPNRCKLGTRTVMLTGASADYTIRPVQEDSANVFVVIPPTGESEERTFGIE